MKTIAWIGTGVMGTSMAGRLMDAGYALKVYNRTREKADGLVDRGALWCPDPSEAARSADAVFTIVGYPADVEEVILGPKGVLAGMSAGALLIDMTTSEPVLAERIAARAKDKGVDALDAPVSGGDTGARNGTLAIMCGGRRDAFERALPLFDILGSNIRLMGGPGAGQHTKMCNQTLIAGTMLGAVESLLYAQKSGLDPDEVIDVIGQGAASSWTINNLGRRIVKGDYAPGFYIKHFLKDMGIALDEAKRMNLSLPGLALVREFYQAAAAQGGENMGTQGLFKVLARMNGLGDDGQS